MKINSLMMSIVIIILSNISALQIQAQNITSDSKFTFALMGDNPYTTDTYDHYLRLISHVNSYSKLKWVLHLGDTKNGNASCSDENFNRLFKLNQTFKAPFIVTPGDNDWLDCKRKEAGSFNEYERLDAFRKIFYSDKGFTTDQLKMNISQQSQFREYPEFVENFMWEYQRVLFATVHVVAINTAPKDPKQMEKRTAAAIDWITKAFEKAKLTNSKGLFLAMQADPWVAWGLPPLVKMLCEKCTKPRPSLEWLYPLLTDLSISFGKPVVLAVGDTHIFRVDKPLYTKSRQLVTNFTRVETFGHPNVSWVDVLVEPNSPWVFSFRQQIVK